MIVEMNKGDVFASDGPLYGAPLRIAFAVNSEGSNDAGFAGLVTGRYWPELAYCGPTGLGSVMTRQVDEDLVLYACAVHSLDRGGWQEAPKYIRRCLDQVADLIAEPDYVNAPVEVVLMGGGPIGQMQGADVYSNLGAMARSKLHVRVWTL